MNLNRSLSLIKVIYNRVNMRLYNISALSSFKNNVCKVGASRICINYNKMYSSENQPTISFNELKKLTKAEDVCIIDVREPDELQQTGVIPNSVNIPLGDIENALKMSDDGFYKKYGRRKPSKDLELIFSCKMGIRSGKAQVISQQLGYKKAKNYLGGWVDWEEQTKK